MEIRTQDLWFGLEGANLAFAAVLFNAISSIYILNSVKFSERIFWMFADSRSEF
jgi:hypothetical protein